MQPSVCSIVQYTLSASDAEAINRRRDDVMSTLREHLPAACKLGDVGNRAVEGDVCAAVVVRTFGPAVNLQVLLDGTDVHWVTSRPQGDTPGSWDWPPRV